MSDWLQQLSELEQQATPGEWSWRTPGPDNPRLQTSTSDEAAGFYRIVSSDGSFVLDSVPTDHAYVEISDEDAAVVVGLRNSATDLISRARRAEELERELDELMDWLVEGLDYGAGVTTTPRIPQQFRRRLAEAWHRADANVERVEDYEAMLEAEDA